MNDQNNRLKTAIIQMNSGENIKANSKKAIALLKKAITKGANFICFAENFLYKGKDVQSIKCSLKDSLLTPFLRQAKKHRVWILAGSIAEEILEEPTLIHNTSCLINPQGELEASYRKIHLFDIFSNVVQYQESLTVKAGDSPTITTLNKRKIGMSICYDLRFPELYRHYASESVDIITIPSNFTHYTGKDHWHTLIRARAIENQCFVIAPNQMGSHGPIKSFGHSLIVGPWGEILAEGSADQEEIIIADLDFKHLNNVRASLPALTHRKLIS
jgi:deaminated glutathione amidase